MNNSRNNISIVINLARKATLMRPLVMKNWETLARNVLLVGDNEQAIEVLADAVSKFPAEPKFYLQLANAYCDIQKINLANDVLNRATEVPIDDRDATIFRFELLMKTGLTKDVVQLATNLLALDPTNISALEALRKVSRAQDMPETMIPRYQAALRQNPCHPFARFELAVALAILGRTEEARRLIDLNQFVALTQLATPDGYANAEEFEGALAGEIGRDPTLEPNPIGKATVGGFQTKNRLPYGGEKALGIALDLIRSEVDKYESKLGNFLADSFVKTRPKRAWLNAWAVIYPGDGRQTAHIHPDGWLSGVYYVSAPKITDENRRDGSLILGPLEINELNVDPPWGIRSILAIPGRLVLFPSYIPHATVPTNSREVRICIAFDVIPV